MQLVLELIENVGEITLGSYHEADPITVTGLHLAPKTRLRNWMFGYGGHEC